MQSTLLANGRLRMLDAAGKPQEIGPEHPEYQRLLAQHDRTARPNPLRARLIGVAAMLVGIGAWWYNWHELLTTGGFYIKLTLLGPLGFFGGLLLLWRPEWAGPVRPHSSKAHKTALFVLIALMAITGGIDFYLLMHYRP